MIGGTLNTTGALVVTAQTVGADTLLSRVVAMVASAQRSKAEDSVMHADHLALT